MTKSQKIEKMRELLRLALELSEPNHKCEKCSMSEKCREAYKRILETEDEFDEEFCYPIVDGDEEDCLIRSEVKKLLQDGENEVASKTEI